jgi:hypothetical protein
VATFHSFPCVVSTVEPAVCTFFTLHTAATMEGYAEFARVGSILFLLLQVFILLDFTYDLQDWMMKKIAARDTVLQEERGATPLCANQWKVR